MKKKIKSWLKKWLVGDVEEWTAKKDSDLRAVCFTSKDPIGNDKYREYTMHMTEWTNGEGWEISLEEYNQLSKKQYNKHFSLCRNEVELLVASLNDFGYFD